VKFSRSFAFTGGVGDPETTDLDRRGADNVKLHGVVKEVDYKRKPPSYRIAFGDEKDEDNYILTDWLPAGGNRAKGDRETHFLEVGEKVSVFHEGGELATGFVMPAGIYNDKNEDEKATTDKAGHRRFESKNGQIQEFDRETGKFLLKASGVKKQDSTSGGSGGGSGGSGSGGSGSGDQEIPGEIRFEIKGLVFEMKDGKLTIAAGETTLEFGPTGYKQTGGKMKHDTKNIGKDHKHTDVEKGGDKTGDPEDAE
jgi:phage baseplate assembly protein gpV